MAASDNLLGRLLPEAAALRTLSPDGRLLFAARSLRMFAFGLLSVILALYLNELGYDERAIGLLFTGMLFGDAVISLWIATLADRIGRRRMLILGSGLMLVGGLVFSMTGHPVVLALAAVFATLSPNGAEAGPFLSIEQAALPQATTDRFRTTVFAWYNLIAMLAKATGALMAGVLAAVMQQNGMTAFASYRLTVMTYAVLSAALGLLFVRLSPAVEVSAVPPAGRMRPLLGLHQSRRTVMKLSALFLVDAFGGGLILQSLVVYWLYVRFGAEPIALGSIFFGVNLLGGLSALAAARLASRFGLINTMVWTHIPSNLLLILIPFMPSLPLAVFLLLMRASISQMDVPTRQSYTMAVVAPDERSTAAGVTSIVRSLGSALAPAITGVLFSASLLGVPFIAAGVVKILYDLALYHNFRTLRPPEEA
jgi:MFS family permease